MRDFAVWDNQGKGNNKSDRFTILKEGKVFFCDSQGRWEDFAHSPEPLIKHVCSEYELDKAWMDKYQVRLDFKDVPVNVQKAIESMV